MINDTITAALDHLVAAHPRAEYARRVIGGWQRWSGADLKGKAKRYGGSYEMQRRHARTALFKAGGCIVAARTTGLLSTPVRLGVDDFGTEVYDATEFGLVDATALRA